MTTIAKDRLLTIKQWRETYGPGSNVVLPAEEAEELARIALASLEAEPVLYQSCTRPTWNLRLAMEKEFPDEEWRSADLRKILMELAKNGTVSKDTHARRIGQAVWRLEVR